MSVALTFRFRAVVAFAAASAFAVPLLAALHTRVPGTTHAALFEPKPSDLVGAFEIGGYLSPNPALGTEIHRAHLVVQDAPALTSHQRILLTVGTYRTVPRLLSGDLSFAGIACAYRTANDVDIADNYFVVFERDPACAASEGRATGDVSLVLRLRNHARIGLTAFISGAAPPRDALVLASPGMAEARVAPILQGATVDVYPGRDATRISLLDYMWNLRASAVWLDATIAACGALIGCAVMIGWPVQPAPRFAAARQAAAAFLAALALSASYAVLYPPFQVADEPSHFLTLTTYIGRPAIGQLSEQLARRGRFEEIRFHPNRPFSSLDRDAPGRPWSEVSDPTRDLYGGVRAVWSLVAPLVRGMDVPQAFLTVRLFHAAGFACAAALFVLLVRNFTGRPASVSAALPLFLVPALPQFGMHVSNYAPLLGAYTLLGAGVVIALWDGPRSWAAGPIMGLGFGAAIGMSRSSLPLLPFVAAILAARAVLGDRAARPPAAWAFWCGFILFLASMLLLIQTSYPNELDVDGRLVAQRATTFTVLLRQPWLVLPFGAAGLIVEWLLTRVRVWVARRPDPEIVRGTALAAAIGVFVLCAASLFVPYPGLPLYLAGYRPTAPEYVRETVLACATFLRFGRPDWLTSVTFFAGFGWLDTVPAVRLVSVLAGTSGVMLILLLVWVARARSARTLLWLGFAAAGFVASAAAYGLSIIRAVPSDLHGRYLIGLYVCALFVCWTGAARAAGSPSSGRYRPLAAAALAGCIAVNVYSLRLILVRYFS